jgi:hypothetical protein
MLAPERLINLISVSKEFGIFQLFQYLPPGMGRVEAIVVRQRLVGGGDCR